MNSYWELIEDNYTVSVRMREYVLYKLKMNPSENIVSAYIDFPSERTFHLIQRGVFNAIVTDDTFKDIVDEIKQYGEIEKMDIKCDLKLIQHSTLFLITIECFIVVDYFNGNIKQMKQVVRQLEVGKILNNYYDTW